MKVLDFGLAKAVDAGSRTGDRGFVHASQLPTITTPALMTGAGVILGTAAYMSPEQADGHAVDVRSDIYALGCVMFKMLTGHVPYSGTTLMDVIMKHRAARCRTSSVRTAPSRPESTAW